MHDHDDRSGFKTGENRDWTAFRLDAEGRMLSVGGQSWGLLTSAVGRTIDEATTADSLRQARESLRAKPHGVPMPPVDVDFASPDGRRVVLEVLTKTAEDTGQGFVVEGIARNVTREREEREMFRALTRDSPVGVFLVQNGKFIETNASMETLTGYGLDELLGNPSMSLVHEDDADTVRADAVAMLKGKRTSPYEYRAIRKDGTFLWVLESVSSVTNDGNRAVLGTFMDISRQKELEGQLLHANHHDHLTGLPNRYRLMERIEQILKQPDAVVALLFCDVDGFKAVNDQYGHAVGDRVLQMIAKRSSAALREADLMARVGGDEFVVLISHASESVWTSIAQRLIETVAEPCRIGDATVSVGLSVGIATCTGSNDVAEEILKRADAAMYQAKASGKGQVAVFQQDQRRAA